MDQEHLLKSGKILEFRGFRFIISVILFSTVGYLIGVFILHNNIQANQPFNYFDKRLFILYIPFVNLAGFILDYMLIKLTNLLPWSRFMFIRFSFGFLIGLIITLFFFGLILEILEPLLDRGKIQIRFSDNELQMYLKLLVILSFILLIYNLLHLVLYSYKKYFIDSLKVKRIRNEQIRLHIEALKNQLTPHYLFNNLNTISSLISIDKLKAEIYIRNFAQSCNYMIENSRNVLISVQQELEFVQAYLYLMQIRFPDSINFEVSLPQSIEKKLIPPLSIQLLVENAIKHNSFLPGKMLNIQISTYNHKYIVIENNLSRIKKEHDSNIEKMKPDNTEISTKVGLKNLISRFALLTHNKVIIEHSNVFTVKLPILNQTGTEYEPKVT